MKMLTFPKYILPLAYYIYTLGTTVHMDNISGSSGSLIDESGSSCGYWELKVSGGQSQNYYIWYFEDTSLAYNQSKDTIKYEFFNNYPIVQEDRIPEAPAEDGDYFLKVSVVNGQPTYSWESETAVEDEILEETY